MTALIPAAELKERQCTKGSRGSNREFSPISIVQLIEVFETVHEKYPGYIITARRVRNQDGKYSFPLERLSHISDIQEYGSEPPYYYVLPSISGDLPSDELSRYSEASLSLAGVPNILITSTRPDLAATHVRRVRSVWCMADDWVSDLSDDGYEPVYRLMLRLVKKQAETGR
ncbi:hypothetical protein GCM10009624_36280 [Gordonia sinesedis]